MQRSRTYVQLHTLIDKVNQKYRNTTANLFEAFHKFKDYYNGKTSAQPLKIRHYLFLLNSNYHTESDKNATKNIPLERSIQSHENTYTFQLHHPQSWYSQNEMRAPHATPQTHTTHENVPDIQLDEHQFYQKPDTTDEPDLFSTHILTNTPSQDQHSEEELHHEMENLQEIVIHLQLETEVPPSLLEHEITMPTPH